MIVSYISGVCRAVAERLITDGWPVAAIDDDDDALEVVEDQIDNDVVVFQ